MYTYLVTHMYTYICMYVLRTYHAVHLFVGSRCMLPPFRALLLRDTHDFNHYHYDMLHACISFTLPMTWTPPERVIPNKATEATI